MHLAKLLYQKILIISRGFKEETKKLVFVGVFFMRGQVFFEKTTRPRTPTLKNFFYPFYYII